jgi:serine/threonine protein phosphatase PrpC
MPRLEAAEQTHIGTRPSNQDRLFAKIATINGQSCGIFCAADGMGGLKDGHTAAELAISAVSDWWETQVENGEVKHGGLSALFQSINQKIFSHAAKQKSAIGTTLSLLLICNTSYYIAHTGDTRIYLIQKSFFRTTFRQLTHDQTWGADKQREGILSQEEINMHPKRNMLTGCLGVFEEAKVFLSSGQIKKSGTFILCSDGMYRLVDRKAITKAATARSLTPEALADNLIKSAESRGVKDNASVVVVSCS